MAEFKSLDFQPLLGLSSRHFQTIFSAYRLPGIPPPTKNWPVFLNDGDCLSCEISTPTNWVDTDKTIILVHGLGGSHSSGYMIRLSRKLYLSGYKVVRINLRGTGSGKGLSKLPYHAGTSSDVQKVLSSLKDETPKSDFVLIGFSLGGNLIIKLAGELGKDAGKLVKSFIAICAPIDLAHTVQLIEKKRNSLYHSYYLKRVCGQAATWMEKNARIKTLYEFDDKITARLWGYENAKDYYNNCSSGQFLSNIQQETHLLFAEDDPFICIKKLKDLPISKHVNLWISKHGGHMGFLGYTKKTHQFYWMDQLILNWVSGDFKSNHKLD